MSTRSANQDAFDSENSKPSSPLAFSFSRASKDMAHPSVIPDPPTDFATPSISSKDPFPPALAPVGKGLPENDRLMAPVTKFIRSSSPKRNPSFFRVLRYMLTSPVGREPLLRFIQYTLRFYVFALYAPTTPPRLAPLHPPQIPFLLPLLSIFPASKDTSFHHRHHGCLLPELRHGKEPFTESRVDRATIGASTEETKAESISRIHGRMQRLLALHHRRPLSRPPPCSPPNLFPPYHPRQWHSGTQAAIVSTVGEVSGCDVVRERVQ
ncbi:hypothetical protein BT69DRAFT_1015347 [Atractiella rhizophila]|nr:hypothetical protein BT69DRAFT_1015347 [Atractiella rhizophila]